YLTRGSYPSLAFASARIWDDGVDWAQLQPNAPTYTPGDGIITQTTSTDGFDQTVVSKLDSVVQNFANHHVDPMITLGMTPSWAANTSGCSYGSYGVSTCPPVDNYADSAGHSFGDPWSNYVNFLATRYDGNHGHPKVTYFELWNEPNFKNGWARQDSSAIAKLASMQASAYSTLHNHGQKMVSPSIAFTAGGGYSWMSNFFSKSGGTAFDIVGLHLYPSDAAAKGGYGPEWSMNTALVGARKVLAQYHLSGRQIWNTETNVGRAPAGTRQGDGQSTLAAAGVARTFILATQNKVARTFWYAADDRSWGGIFLEKSDYKTLTTAGVGYRTVRSLLVGRAPLGCSRTTVGANKWKYTCKFGTTAGHKTLLAIWTTGGSYTLKAPAGTKSSYTVAGVHRSAYAGKKFAINHYPVYLVGSFK
ncbi:MAG: hypothetical protein QOF53_3001, partial [Nocardioidaceae bacterium]|nr:hypothetical protein [Nocardioidaceae bacterium]